MSEMHAQRAIAWLIVGLINDHFPHPDDESDDDPELGSSGCIVRCGPCGALHWLAANNRAVVEEMIRLTGYHDGGWAYWDDETDGLRWDWFESFWARHKGCAVSDGVVLPCEFEEDEATA